MTNLIRDFDGARLPLELPPEPIVRASRDIFQMDIQRRRGAAELFRLWQGAPGNEVRVTSADRGRRQLVLLVQEPRRTFEERLSKRFTTEATLRARGLRPVRETAEEYVIERATRSSLRRYLCGMDERHLFIARFDGGTTVRDAHRLLKPAAVRDAERGHAGRVLRQGEWFFVPLGPVDRRLLEALVRERPWAVRRNESLGGNGRPHVAAEVIRDGGRVYARGAVRHVDHRTLVLDEWRRVHRNAEVPETRGVYWID